MKKLFLNIVNWFKSLFSKTKTEEEIEQEMLAKKFSKETFDAFKERGLFDDEPNRDREFINSELAKSAEKQNNYKDAYHKVAQMYHKPDEKIDGLKKDIVAKDKTALKRQEIKDKKPVNSVINTPVSKKDIISLLEKKQTKVSSEPLPKLEGKEALLNQGKLPNAIREAMAKQNFEEDFKKVHGLDKKKKKKK